MCVCRCNAPALQFFQTLNPVTLYYIIHVVSSKVELIRLKLREPGASLSDLAFMHNVCKVMYSAEIQVISPIMSERSNSTNLLFVSFVPYNQNNHTFACRQTSLVPSPIACSAAEFVPSMRCQNDRCPTRTTWTVADKAWGRVTGGAACYLSSTLLCCDWLFQTQCPLPSERTPRLEAREIGAW